MVIKSAMKNFVINNSINMIKNLNKYNDIQLEEIKYGLEGIYLTLSKVIVILLISLILKIFKEVIIFLVIFNILRLTCFGIHASKSILCWFSSILSFAIIPLICKNIVFFNYIYIILPIICIICFILYALADTVKRPLINKKKRKIYKFISIINACIFLILIITIDNYLFKNLLMFAMLLETVLILPITYKIFKLPYNNYLNYKE